MSGHWLLASVFALVVLCPAVAAPADPIPARDIKGNIEVRLVAAMRSENRGQNLMAKFETRDKERKEIAIAFPSGGFTAHEVTLMNIVYACVAHQPSDASGWRPVRKGVEAVFSIPAGGLGGNYKLLERCYLVSLKLGDGKDK